MKNSTRIKLCVGGRFFKISHRILKKSKFFEDYLNQFPNFNPKKELITINKSSTAFKHVFRYMTDPLYEVPENYSQDLKYYCIEGNNDDFEENKKLILEKKQKMAIKIVSMEKNIALSHKKLIDNYTKKIINDYDCIYYIGSYYPMRYYLDNSLRGLGRDPTSGYPLHTFSRIEDGEEKYYDDDKDCVREIQDGDRIYYFEDRHIKEGRGQTMRYIHSFYFTIENAISAFNDPSNVGYLSNNPNDIGFKMYFPNWFAIYKVQLFKYKFSKTKEFMDFIQKKCEIC